MGDFYPKSPGILEKFKRISSLKNSIRKVLGEIHWAILGSPGGVTVRISILRNSKIAEEIAAEYSDEKSGEAYCWKSTCKN